ncbi:hypothetical protein DERF_009812 [Dermatophagoides farinae]|uniref:Retrovirus-related Pol polyprotein from transposon TNT 1-94-like beta-barrel domain-containing protein n=1 Tax=Dermatophagoides farinae TaxID=6954 RepID=A0A922L1A7_DERFA|nr:hypothetical protein DERF_009812 [Dermatophagoides farinae]
MAENNDNNRGNNGDQNLLKSLTDLFCQLNNRLSYIENQDRTTNDGNIVNHTNRVKSNHENYVLSQIVKYDGKNLKHWLTSVKSAFRSCGYSHFLESELDENHPDYAIYQNCLGTISLTFIPEKFEVIEHCKSVFQVWSHMAKVEKDTYATAVRKFTELINCSYKGGSLRTWLETIIAKFESIESEWCKYTDKHRCVIVMCMLRSNSKFEQLADRIMMNQNGTMNDIMNEFIEYDEKVKSQSISSNFGSNEKAKSAKEKKKFKNGLKCSYCHKTGHKIEDCWEKQKCTPSSSTTNEKSSSTSQMSNSKNQKKVAKTLILKSVEKSSNVWILDSGSTSHTTVDENLLIDPEDKQVEFELASDETVTSKKIGNIIIQPKPDCKLLLKDVAYGGFSSNLISVRKLTEDGFKIIFEDNVAHISKNDISFTAKTDENNLWIINSQPKNIVLNLWHKRLAHCGQNVLKRIKNDVPDINLKYETCEDCMINKSISIPHHTPMIYNNVKQFEMLHVDLWEAPVPSAHDHFELNQTKYIRKIMNEFRMNECKPTNVPMASLYIHNEDEEIDENLPIRELIGSLLYVANKTRPDILFSTNWLSRFLTKPTKSLFNAAKQILRYLSGTIDKCLVIGHLDENLLVYTDSSFGQGESKHSTSGLVIRCGNSTIEWKSNKQRKISVSSCESEITAIMDGYKCVTLINKFFNFSSLMLISFLNAIISQ